MKFLHLADLHLGKSLNGFSLIEDQAFILDRIVAAASKQRPEAVIIAGDLYDSPTPSTEAVRICDEFLTSLVSIPCQVLIISGNHDSAERLSFLRTLIKKQGIIIADRRLDKLEPVILEDQYGEVHFYLLPYVRPAEVRRYYPDSSVDSYTQAVQTVLSSLKLSTQARKVLVAHQFVTGGLCSDSELSVGGTDNVDSEVFRAFDYVALGHLHRPQVVDSPRIRYCGSPLKYSFSELGYDKTLSLITLGEKGSEVVCQELALRPKRDLRELQGAFADLIREAQAGLHDPEDYYRVCLTDPQEIPDAMQKMRTVLPRVMQVILTRPAGSLSEFETSEEVLQRQSPLEQFAEFFRQQHKRELSAEQAEICSELIGRIWGEGR